MTETQTNGNGAGAAYRSQVKTETVDVEVTNGFIFKMRSRSVFKTVFEQAVLPQTLGSGAVEKWQEQGLIKPGEMTEDQSQKVDFLLEVANQVVDLSVHPKIVMGEAGNDNEVSYKDIAEADLEILFVWAATGGKVSGKLANFSSGAKPSPVAGTHRKKQRSKSK